MSTKSNKDDGARWESECKVSLKSVPGLDLKSGNSTLPDNDFYGSYRGWSFRCECKTTVDGSLPWSKFQGSHKANQRRTLQRNHDAGGLSFLAISRELSLFERRVWVCTWENFLQLLAHSPSGGSFRLEEPVDHMLEVVPLRPEHWARKNSRPYFDFGPFMEREFARYLVRELKR